MYKRQLQGDALAPFLFIIVIDYILRKVPVKFGFTTHICPLKVLSDLNFADDIILLDNDLKSAEEHIEALTKEASVVGLKMNLEKTKYMTNIKDIDDKYKLNDEIEKVNDYKYLGSYLNSTLKEFNIRRALSCKAFRNMNKIWRSDMPTRMKLKLFKTLCIPILLYGCETWIMTKEIIKKLNAFVMNCYRIIIINSIMLGAAHRL